MREDVFVVTLPGLTCNFPLECASCMGDAPIAVPLRAPLSVHYCAKCAARAMQTSSRDLPFFGAVLIAGAACPLVPILLPWFSIDASVYGVVVAFAIGVYAWLSGRRRKLPKGATARGSAAWLLRVHPFLVFGCSNEQWAASLAELNAGSVERQRRLRGSSERWVAPLVAVGGGILSAGAVAAICPKIHVDHVGDAPIDVWIDGKREERLAQGRTTIYVRPGTHVLAWSWADGAPVSTYTLELRSSQGVLLNPGTTACYWRSVSYYGLEPATGVLDPELSDGPVRLAELYAPKQVDVWFAENPSTKKSSEGRTSVAINRDEACTSLLQRGCARATVEEMIACEERASTHKEIEACYADARAGCPK